MPRRTLSKVETVVYNGITFRRYPEADALSDQRYFRPNSVQIRRGVETLHREIWKAHHGTIPDGYHIHHIDGDAGNNAIENLACLSPEQHAQYHAATLTDEQRQRRRDNMDTIRPLAAEWHRSEAGRAWHTEHAREIAGNMQPKPYVCEQCGASFESKKRSRTRFCSNNCKTAWRNASGIDDETRICAWCQSEFRVNRYTSTKNCSSSCAAYSRNKHR